MKSINTVNGTTLKVTLNEDTKNAIRDRFISAVRVNELNIDLTADLNSDLLNYFSNKETRKQFNLFLNGAAVNLPAFAAGSFGFISGEVYDAINSWYEEKLGMAGDLLFFINHLYVKHFGVGFMTITEKKP